MIIECINCGITKEMKSPKAKFCSRKCRNQYNKSNYGHDQTCKHCSKGFINYSKRDFCSTQCYSDFRIENSKKSQYIPRPKMTKICINCNQHYETHTEKSKYCGYRCKYEYTVKQKTNHNVKCSECSCWFTTTDQRKLFCSSGCKDKFHDRKKETLRRKRIKQNGKINWDISIERLMKRDKGICYLCGNKVNVLLDPNDDEYPSIEHVIPIVKGGTHTWGNVKLAHRKCNYIKSDKVV